MKTEKLASHSGVTLTIMSPAGTCPRLTGETTTPTLHCGARSEVANNAYHHPPQIKCSLLGAQFAEHHSLCVALQSACRFTY